MMDRPILAVVGATGAQGGGLVRAALGDPERRYAVRALTRDAAAPKARALRALGVEVVTADLDDAESLERAFAGASAAFCVTFYGEHRCPLREHRQAQKLACAAAVAQVGHVIWSTLEDTRRWLPLRDGRMPTLKGEYNVPHYDAKGESDRLFTTLGVPTTFLLTAFYWENLFRCGMAPQRGGDGRLALRLPLGDRRLPGIAAEDIGRCAYGIFQEGSGWIGKTVGIAGGLLTGAELAQGLGTALGEAVRYVPLPPAVYRSLGFTGADELGNLFQVQHDFNEQVCAARDPAVARRLNPELQDFATWIERNGARLM